MLRTAGYFTSDNSVKALKQSQSTDPKELNDLSISSSRVANAGDFEINFSSSRQLVNKFTDRTKVSKYVAFYSIRYDMCTLLQEWNDEKERYKTLKTYTHNI